MSYCYSCFAQIAEGQQTCPVCGKPTVPETPSHRLKPGTLLRERYTVGRALGEGGFGITYVGFDNVLQMKVAVKEFFPNGFSNRDHNDTPFVTIRTGSQDYDFLHDMQRFLDEARTLAKFADESGVVGVRDFFQENNTAYIIMEFLDGITLKDYIRKGGLIPASKLVAVLDPVLASLSRVHEAGLIHRDISPDNIMVLRSGRLKLLDFGAARDVSGEKSLSVVLKPGYAPEEQYRTRGNQGPWTDVYAMSATMYKCITGKTPLESLERAYDDTLKKPSELGINILPAVEEALMKGLAVRARDRYQSIRELRDALKAASGMESASISRPRPESAQESTDTPSPAAENEEEERTVLSRPQKSEERSRSKLPPVKTAKKAPESKAQPAKKAKDTKKKSKLPLILGGAAAVIALIALAGSLMGGASAPKLSSASGATRYTLTAAGTIADQERALRFTNDTINIKHNSTTELYSILDASGKDLTGEKYASVSGSLGHGLITATLPGDWPNRTVLLSSDGDILIDEPVSRIAWPEEGNPAGHRFLMVSIAEGPGTEDDYLVAVKDGNVYDYKVDGAEFYDGAIRIFDLERKAYVPNTPEIKRPGRVQVVNDCLLFRDNDDTYPLFYASGNEITRFSSQYGTADGGDGLIRMDEGTTYHIYDTEGNSTYYANTPLIVIDNSRYVEYTTDSGKTRNIIDRDGNPVLKLEDGLRVNEYIAELEAFVVYKDEKYGMVDLIGKEILPVEYEYITEDYLDGYGYVRYGRDKYALFGPEGFIATGLDSSGYDMCLKKDNRYYVFNDRDYTLEVAGNATSLTYALLNVADSATGLRGVYDLFSGEKLLDTVYEKVEYAYGNIYAYRNGAWEVYQTDLIFG